MIQQRQHLGFADAGACDAVFEGVLRQRGPELLLFAGVVGELLLGGADADPLRALESDGERRGGLDAQQDEALAVELDLVEPEVDARFEQARPPSLDGLVADLAVARVDGGADRGAGRIVDAPDDPAGVLAEQGGGVGEGAHVLADILGFGVAALELDPLALRLREQAAERGFEGHASPSEQQLQLHAIAVPLGCPIRLMRVVTRQVPQRRRDSNPALRLQPLGLLACLLRKTSHLAKRVAWQERVLLAGEDVHLVPLGERRQTVWGVDLRSGMDPNRQPWITCRRRMRTPTSSYG